MPDVAITMRLTKAGIMPGYQHELEKGSRLYDKGVPKCRQARIQQAWPCLPRVYKAAKKRYRKLVQSNTIRDNVVYMELDTAK